MLLLSSNLLQNEGKPRRRKTNVQTACGSIDNCILNSKHCLLHTLFNFLKVFFKLLNNFFFNFFKFFFKSEFLVGIDSITCSVNKFVYQIKYGESGTHIPRWMGIDNIMKSYQAAINMIPGMSQNYASTFQDNKNKSEYYLNQTNTFISKLDVVYRNYKDMKFENINPRKSQAIGDNSLRPSFLTVIICRLKIFEIILFF